MSGSQGGGDRPDASPGATVGDVIPQKKKGVSRGTGYQLGKKKKKTKKKRNQYKHKKTKSGGAHHPLKKKAVSPNASIGRGACQKPFFKKTLLFPPSKIR